VFVVALVFSVLLYFSLLASSLARGANPPRATAGSIVAQSDRRSFTAGWLLLAGVVVPPIAIVGMLVLLALDGWAWTRAVAATLRQRRGRPPATPGLDFGLGPDWTQEAPPSVPYRASAGPVLAARGSPRAAARALAGNMERLFMAIVLATLWLGMWSAAFVSASQRLHFCDRDPAVSVGSG
jgi:hypothetical protein